MLKAVILIGGPSKGTRFRPLSLDIPKPLFPIAGLPMIEHHIKACLNIKNLNEILIIGSYNASELQSFVKEMTDSYGISIRYLQELTALGTAGGIYHFRAEIRAGDPDAFFIMNGDVCANFPLSEMLEMHIKTSAVLTVMATEATRQQSLNYGCIVPSKEDCRQVVHYVEKPSTFVSTLINCGVYLASLDIFQFMADVFDARHKQDKSMLMNGNGKDPAYISLEQDILTRLSETGKFCVFQTSNWWSQVKTPGAAIYANRHHLAVYRSKESERLLPPVSGQCQIIGNVFIDASAVIHPTATLGPNVSIGPNVRLGAGVRIRESIVLANSQIQSHSMVLHSIIGRGSVVGEWARVEGTPCDPDPDKPFAKKENPPLFNVNGKLNPSISILGESVTLAAERILLNSIVLPYKQLTRDLRNEIIL
ncbi:mannose-1-phosphate guanyltransferase alpha [Fopius arisanus]|uniref:Gmppa_0 protein n=1 Tax=Fopius arisanus TaxID=64838 RepID=A0A0C9RM48_9HYME|nr:PREDICTED: mannose-1-phosphate guanyltransferase alpha [Fopius arisanus]